MPRVDDITLRRGDGYSPAGTKREHVRALQRCLSNLGYKLDIDGEFGPATEAAVIDVQRRAAITMDGIAGPDTRRALVELLYNDGSHGRQAADMTIGERIATIAAKYRGQRERPGNSGFVDRKFEEAMRKVGWWKSAAWCDFFAELVWCEAYANNLKVVGILKRMFTGGTLRSFANFKKSGLFYISDEPSVGALGYFKYGRTTGHVVITTGVRTGDHEFQAISGNTSVAGGREGVIVAEKPESVRDRRLLGFVHPLEIGA